MNEKEILKFFKIRYHNKVLYVEGPLGATGAARTSQWNFVYQLIKKIRTSRVANKRRKRYRNSVDEYYKKYYDKIRKHTGLAVCFNKKEQKIDAYKIKFDKHWRQLINNDAIKDGSFLVIEAKPVNTRLSLGMIGYSVKALTCYIDKYLDQQIKLKNCFLVVQPRTKHFAIRQSLKAAERATQAKINKCIVKALK